MFTGEQIQTFKFLPALWFLIILVHVSVSSKSQAHWLTVICHDQNKSLIPCEDSG